MKLSLKVVLNQKIRQVNIKGVWATVGLLQ